MGAKCGDSGKENIQVFKRKWICEFYFIFAPTDFNAATRDSFADYFCYCETGFASKLLGGEAKPGVSELLLMAYNLFIDHVITFMREGCPMYGCNL